MNVINGDASPVELKLIILLWPFFIYRIHKTKNVTLKVHKFAKVTCNIVIILVEVVLIVSYSYHCNIGGRCYLALKF